MHKITTDNVLKMTSLNNRESKFELIRIIAMFMIIGSHLFLYGITPGDSYVIWNQGSTLNQIFSCFLYPGGLVGDGLFFILTGYFLINNNHINLLKVILETFYYGMLAVVVYGIASWCGFKFDNITTNLGLYGTLAEYLFIPVSSDLWWFVTSYVILIAIHPLINIIFKKINRKGILIIFLLFWLIFFPPPMFDIQRAIFFYSIGAYLNLQRLKSLDSKFIDSFQY
jgi:surface polysaccharide O-acyltransferase-like enzyme